MENEKVKLSSQLLHVSNPYLSNHGLFGFPTSLLFLTTMANLSSFMLLLIVNIVYSIMSSELEPVFKENKKYNLSISIYHRHLILNLGERAEED